MAQLGLVKGVEYFSRRKKQPYLELLTKNSDLNGAKLIKMLWEGKGVGTIQKTKQRGWWRSGYSPSNVIEHLWWIIRVWVRICPTNLLLFFKQLKQWDWLLFLWFAAWAYCCSSGSQNLPSLPPSLSSPIIHFDFDWSVILWLWIIGHYSRNYHYILLIRARRIYSSEMLKDVQVEPSYVLQNVTLWTSPGDGWRQRVFPSVAGMSTIRPRLWALWAESGSGSPWRGFWGKGVWHRLNMSRVATHTWGRGRAHNCKHGPLKEKAMHEIFFMIFPP